MSPSDTVTNVIQVLIKLDFGLNIITTMQGITACIFNICTFGPKLYGYDPARYLPHIFDERPQPAGDDYCNSIMFAVGSLNR